MTDVIFLKPVMHEKIWGGDKLKTYFGYAEASDTVGEDWAISAHPNGLSVIENGEFAGRTLKEVWEQEPAIFGGHKDEPFPLLTKILDAKDDLSVQVHPDDEYARKHEGPNELGKTECWYIIDAEPGAHIVYGHNAKTREELRAMIEADEWDELLRKVPVKKGDFFYVPSGTIHAICAGILILETQQSSDTTYRVYDYHRLGDDGVERELHVEQSIAVTTVPATTPQNDFKIEDGITTFVSNDFFSVYEWDIKKSKTIQAIGAYTLATVISGGGVLIAQGKEYKLKMGASFVIPAGVSEWTIEGEIRMIASHV
ncbi:MAG: mannose-6-phosphate isomerase, class I [Lactobacillales bacterium]|jgi:mannose-6-phosphate isomerase|nr:mannose-6-phosphate isomerase, class I [Lactobacillales bacterium]